MDKNNKKIMPKITNKIIDDYYHFVVTALGLVVALAWNSAFQNFFQKNKYLTSHGPWVYAIIVTLIIILIIIIFDIVKKKIYIDLDNNNIPNIVV